MLKNTLRLLALSLPLLLAVGAFLVNPKPVKASGSHLIPITAGYCDVEDGYPTLHGTWARFPYYYSTTQQYPSSSTCSNPGPLNTATVSSARICKVGICCHWVNTSPAPNIYVDDNNNPIGPVFISTPMSDQK